VALPRERERASSLVMIGRGRQASERALPTPGPREQRAARVNPVALPLERERASSLVVPNPVALPLERERESSLVMTQIQIGLAFIRKPR
jgi:hypothetical protein